MDRATAISLSLRGFGFGIVGFLPFLGLLPGLYALRCWHRVRTRFRGQWNPASAYLGAGAWLATLGLAGTLLIVLSYLVTQFA